MRQKLTSMARALVFESLLDTACIRESLAAWMRPEGELGGGGDDGGEGIGDGVKGRLQEKLKEPKEMGERPAPLRTMGMGEDTPLLLLADLEGSTTFNT